jgi:flavin-dependent dehydrogenase
MDYDIIIAGAGPAGLNAAAELSKHELRVLLLEKNKISQTDKTWAGFTEEFKQRDLMHVVDRSVKTAGLSTFIHGKMLRKVDFSILNQKKFLLFLKSKLGRNVKIKKNCEFKSFHHIKDRISITTNKGNFKAKILIDASGFKSPVSRKYKLQDDIFVWQCLAYEIDRTSPKNLNEMLWDMPWDSESEVNFWIDLLAKNKCSIGLMYLTKSNKLMPWKSISRLLEKYLKLRNINGKQTAVRKGIIAMNNFQKMSFDNILLVGNSASQAAPDTGYGLIPAIDNGILAAKIAAEAVKKQRFDKQFLKKYDTQWAKKYKMNYRFNHMLQLAHYYLKPKDVAEMVDCFKSNTKWMIKKTESKLASEEMKWFFDSAGRKIPVSQLIKKLPITALLQIIKDYILLKKGFLSSKLFRKI